MRTALNRFRGMTRNFGNEFDDLTAMCVVEGHMPAQHGHDHLPDKAADLRSVWPRNVDMSRGRLARDREAYRAGRKPVIEAGYSDHG